MPVLWLRLNPDGYSWTVWPHYVEVAPSIEPGASKHAKQTWFIGPIVPDGICMNCRKRPGLQDPIFGYYSCVECRAATAAALQTATPQGRGSYGVAWEG